MDNESGIARGFCLTTDCCQTSKGHGVQGAWGQTEFQVNLELGLTPHQTRLPPP